MTPNPADDPRCWTLARLADHLKATDHRSIKEAAPRAAAYARRIRDVHAAQHPELGAVATAADGLAAALEAHLGREEDLFFPALRRAEKAVRHDSPVAADDAAEIIHAVGELGAEHASLLAAMDDLRDLTMDYALPFDACATYDLAYRTLRELDATVRRHLLLEDDVLLPRARALVETGRPA